MAAPISPTEKPAAVTTRDGLNFVLMLAPLTPGRNSDNELVHDDGAYV